MTRSIGYTTSEMGNKEIKNTVFTTYNKRDPPTVRQQLGYAIALRKNLEKFLNTRLGPETQSYHIKKESCSRGQMGRFCQAPKHQDKKK